MHPGIRMLNSVSQDLVAPRRVNSHIHQLLLCKPCPLPKLSLIGEQSIGSWAWGSQVDTTRRGRRETEADMGEENHEHTVIGAGLMG